MDLTKNWASYLSDSDLIKICSEVLEWKHKSGRLPENSVLQKVVAENYMEIQNYMKICDSEDNIIRDDIIREDIINEANKRFKDVVLLLMSEDPYKYLRI